LFAKIADIILKPSFAWAKKKMSAVLSATKRRFKSFFPLLESEAAAIGLALRQAAVPPAPANPAAPATKSH